MAEENGDYFDEEDQGQSAFEQAKEATRNWGESQDLLTLVTAQRDAKIEKEAAEAALSAINARFDVLRFELVPSKMDDEGIEKISYDGIGRVSLTGDLQVATLNKSGLFEWLKDRGLGDLIQPSINASTLKASFKARIKDGKEVPSDDLVKITPITRASITRTPSKVKG